MAGGPCCRATGSRAVPSSLGAAGSISPKSSYYARLPQQSRWRGPQDDRVFVPALDWPCDYPAPPDDMEDVEDAQGSGKRPIELEESPLKRHKASTGSTEYIFPTSVSNETAIAKEDTRQRIVERVDKLLTTINTVLGVEVNNVHSPHHRTAIPFPALSASNRRFAQKFNLNKINGVEHFDYRGRCILNQKVLPMLRQLYDTIAPTTLGFLGTKGAGRAHISTAAASVLLLEGYPVVFLPLSVPILSNAAIRDAIHVALRNDKVLHRYTDTLFDMCCKYDGLGGILHFCNYIKSKQLKLVFIMLNLDLVSEEDLNMFLNMADGHVLLFTAGGNSSLADEKAAEVAMGSVDAALYLNGGLEENEVGGWYHQYEVESKVVISKDEQALIQTTTGNVPLLLSELFRAVKAKGRFNRDLLNVSLDLYAEISKHLQEPMKESPNETSKLLLAVLNNSPLDVPRRLPDRRYMYRGKDRRWRYTCLFVFEATYHLALQLQDCFREFQVKSWLQCLPLLARNPSMLEYALKYAITAELRHGVTLSHFKSKLTIPPLPLFPLPAGGAPTNVTKSGLYVPLEFNHRHVDCIAVWFEPTAVHIVPIQISNVTKRSGHSDSRYQFFAADWLLWQEAVNKTNVTSIQWHFLWIIRATRCKWERFEKLEPRSSKGGASYPSHEIFTTGFNSISQNIYDKLPVLPS
ncbi:hypothetical protein GGX14DRAFT_384808 [Mycena pura]|uniref:Uncharacterized protein n=1 Tax=Mycena pura TaxID=153505 RepID=A0AAD7E508_9AGAR|nr:hypothetical protein GGX14DRAFT_384808 [Mycena pura]